jgi:hypothetical protein
LLAKQADDNRAYARGYQMRAYDDSELSFPSFGKCREHSVQIGNIVRAGWPIFTGVDLSSDKRPGTCIFTMALEPGTHRRYPINVRLGAWTSPQTVGQLSEVLNQYPSTQLILVENNAYQQALVDWIRTTQAGRIWLKVESFTTTGQNKANAMYGLPSLEAEFSKRMWVVPYNEYEHHNPSCLCGWCVWDRQMSTYPHCPETDTVMATWFAREALNRWLGLAGGIAASTSNFNDR